MSLLYKNPFNKNLRRDHKKFKIWNSAGLMISYRCSAACRFCYYNCSPAGQGLMPVETAIKTWKGLKKLAPNDASIHITGGEAFLFFEHVLEIMQAGLQEGLGNVNQLETNASWATDEADISSKIKQLDKLGLNILKISCDPFHLEFVDVENVQRLVDIAQKIIGPERVLVRWQEYLDNPIPMKEMSDNKKIDAFKENHIVHPFRFTSRAANSLGAKFAKMTIGNIESENCIKAFRDPKEVHIDPYGNVFSGVCSGIMLGNVNKIDLDKLWKSVDINNMELVSTLCKKGPVGLLETAAAGGFVEKEIYASKCHLCSDLREFFFDNGRYKSIIGPKDCY